MPHMFTIVGSSASGLGALGINGSAFLIQLVTFVIGYFVLRHFAFGPIIKILDERRAKIEKGVQLSDQMQRDRETLDKTIKEANHEARRKADAIIADANDAAKAVLRDVEATASAKADAIIQEAQERSVQEAARMRRSIESEVTSLISEVTEALIHEKVDASKDASLIQRALREQLPQ